MTDDELRAKNLRRKELRRLLDGGAVEAREEHDDLVRQIAAEKDRRDRLSGFNLEERKLQDSSDLVEANRRMAEAAERAAAASEVSALEAGRSATQARAAVVVAFATFLLSLVAFFGLKGCGS